MERLKLYTLPVIIALTALSVSASAAFYSVTGLSKLFAGARLEVIIMAGSLEVAKLVIASLLYQYRKTIPSVLKYYLTTAAVVLVLITSMGIYGFLSAAYQETATKAGTIDAQIALIETKRDNVTSQLQSYNTEKVNIDKAVADLRAGLANNVIQYKDKDGNLITTTSSATRRALENQLDQAIERQNSINTKVDGLNEQLFAYETEIVEVSTSSGLASELGPLKYLAGITGVSMDKIVNILLLIIVFVFDPLAISLVIAANFAFAQIKPKVKESIYKEKVVVDDDNEGTDVYTKGELEDWIDDLPQEVIDEVLKGEEFDIRDLNKDGVVDEREKSIFKILEETNRQYKVMYDDGTVEWVNKAESSNRKVY